MSIMLSQLSIFLCEVHSTFVHSFFRAHARYIFRKGRDMMSTVDHFQALERDIEFPWWKYLVDSTLASLGALLVTAAIFMWHLYPRIPNISIIYLLVVIGFASMRGSYAAIVASVVAFLSFDFFIVPPLFTFVMYRPEEWIALIVFLVDAVLTGQMAAALHVRAEAATRREQETRMLYNLVRVATREEEPARQLHVIARAIVDVFAQWGVLDCAILQPVSNGKLSVQTSAYQPIEQMTLSGDEQAMAHWVMTHKRPISLYDDAALLPSRTAHFVQRIIVPHATQSKAAAYALRLLPLQIGQRVVGVLRLRMIHDPRHNFGEERFEESPEQPNARTTFFWTFLDQATSLIERANLRRENLRIEILQRTDTLRAALLSSVSHDLRTPLTSIKASASSLLQEDVQWDEEARYGFARAIEREADRLNRLVGNLLDMSRIEEGALKPEKEWFPLAELIRDVVNRLQPLLHGRVIHKHLPKDLPPVELDYLQIDQVLTNLLENAIRYTPPESPIDINAQYDGSEIIVSVADRGPGIPPAELERVFDKFYRVLSTPRAVGSSTGSGLGLAVCRGVLEAHGGRIWAEPRTRGGVVFFMTLPVNTFEGALT